MEVFQQIALVVAGFVVVTVGTAFASIAWRQLRRSAARLTGISVGAVQVEFGNEPVSRVPAPAVTLEGRLRQLRDLMAESAVLSEQVSAELEARATTARKLQEEAATAEALAQSTATRQRLSGGWWMLTWRRSWRQTVRRSART